MSDTGYLIMKRKVGETVRVGNDIEFIINRINRGSVTVAVRASRSTRVERGVSEIADQLRSRADEASEKFSPKRKIIRDGTGA